MMTDEDYRRKWKHKEEWFALSKVVRFEDAKEGDDKLLITTKDKPDGGINSEEILSIIRKMQKLQGR